MNYMCGMHVQYSGMQNRCIAVLQSFGQPGKTVHCTSPQGSFGDQGILMGKNDMMSTHGLTNRSCGHSLPVAMYPMGHEALVPVA